MPDDLRIALRKLWRQPTFSVTAVVTLAVGIGATTAIFSTVNATLLRPLPFPQSEDLYTLSTTLVDGRWTSGRVTAAYLAAINESAPSVIRAVASVDSENILISDEGENREALVHGVSEGFFDLFGLPMAEGRALGPEDYPSENVVISHRVWGEMFGRDPAAVGRSIQLATGSGTIVGVAPPALDVPEGSDV